MLATVLLCVSVLAAPAATDFRAKVAASIDRQPLVLAVASTPTMECDPLPQDRLDTLVSRAAADEGLPQELIRAVIQKESASKPCVVSPKGAQGLMQLMPGTAKHFGVLDAFDPKQNVEAGAKFLKQLLARYNGDLSLALDAYNGRPVRVDEPGLETINDLPDVLSEIFTP